MFLRYLNSAPEAEALVLRNDGAWRVELFLLRNNDDSFSLVALSGQEASQAERVKLQGPYQYRDVAVAARSAIARELIAADFVVADTAHPQWRVMAQRHINTLRAQRAENTPDCHFDPKDVL